MFSNYYMLLLLVILALSNFATCRWCTREIIVPESVKVTKSKWYGLRKETELQTKNVTKTIRECCVGFEQLGSMCVSQCINGCVNSKCIGPNVCECLDGYKIMSPNRCIPICTNCDNGECTFPESCVCYRHYIKSDNGTCIPSCEPSCENADCIAPDKCQCWPNYIPTENDQHKCVSICDNCDNGTCISPGNCQCNDGYIKATDGTCQLDCEPSCENGTCIIDCLTSDDQETCEYRNICKCNAGLEWVGGRCLERCNHDCGHGMCYHNQCLCDAGYEPGVVNQFFCEPVCRFNNGSCVNGYCKEPGKCLCNDGYEARSINLCMPICNRECINGFCSRPNECTCLDGYLSLNDHHCVKTDLREAIWNCQSRCIDGTCDIETAQCICHNGLLYNSTTENCHEAVTITDENYDSNDYPEILDNEHTTISLIDNNTISSESDEDSSDTHEDTEDDETEEEEEEKNGDEKIEIITCEDVGCLNGKCIDKECQCYEGYKQKDNNTICEPVCAFDDGHDCVNGFCIAPNKCQCYDGYRKLENKECTCIMDCNPPCVGGNCIKKDTCECFEGYLSNGTNHLCYRNGSIDYDGDYEGDQDWSTSLEPIVLCDNGCFDNAICVGFNECECHAGFILSDDNSSCLIKNAINLLPIETETIQFARTFEPVDVGIFIILIVVTLIIMCISAMILLYKRSGKTYLIQQKEMSTNCVYYSGAYENNAVVELEL